MNKKPMNVIGLGAYLGAVLFWIWNIVFLAFLFLGFGPTILPELILSLRAGVTPIRYILYAVILVLVPIACVVLALTVFRRKPGSLFALGYVVEGPLMLLLVLMLFVVRETTLTIALLALIASVGMAAFLWKLIHQPSRLLWRVLQAAGLTFMLVTAIYAALWVAFYVPPLAVMVWQQVRMLFEQITYIFGNLTWQWRQLPLTILGMLLFGITAILVILMPISVPILASRAWWSRARALAAQIQIPRAVFAMGVPLIVWGILLGWSMRQPQAKAFDLLSSLPASPAEAQALLDQEEKVRSGLLNAYLASFRYLSAVGEVSHVRWMYMSEPFLRLDEQSAYSVQQAYEGLIRPLLYAPVHSAAPGEIRDTFAFVEEPREAAQLYEDFFDEPINDGEREAIVKAVRSTWSADQAETALQAVDDREVRLNRQEVRVEEHGDWADVELYEVYQNLTGEFQEVIYYFSLPESAAVTGVWLGSSSNRAARSVYRVAPRGAAQAAYRAELIRNVDPALVEQIGPRQYRLRIYPIEPINITYDNVRSAGTIHQGKELHLWLTYRTPALDGAWPLPQLSDHYNVFWDQKSQRSVAGKTLKGSEPSWLPENIPAAGPVTPVEHTVALSNGSTVTARPADLNALPELPADLRVAVVLDRSRSMAAQAGHVADALARLNQLSASADMDVYLTSSPYRGEAPSRSKLSALDPEQILYYGGQNAAELLIQFQKLRAGESYDVVLVLTDGTGYELGEEGQTAGPESQPVWIVHLGGFPLGYDDATLDAVQASGGGVAGSIDEALNRLAVRLNGDVLGGPGAVVDLADGYLWITQRDAATAASEDAFTVLAARRAILAEMQRQRGELTNLDVLDSLHQIAVDHSVVTPYSSMIVLLTQEQQRRLDNLENNEDRFDRELEELGDTTGADPFAPPPISGVPEPEEWILIAVAAILLTYVLATRRHAG